MWTLGETHKPNARGRQDMRQTIRTMNGKLLAPILRITGLRFSRIHRKTEDVVYRWIDTVGANQAAEGR